MSFLESDVQGSEYICHDLMNDINAVEDGSVNSREFIGNAHSVQITANGVVIASNIDDLAAPEDQGESRGEDQGEDQGENQGESRGEGDAHSDTGIESEYQTTLKHFSEVLADWEAFILDEEDPIDDSLHV